MVLNSLVLLCEVNDYFGRFKPEEEFAAPGAAILDGLPQRCDISEQNFELIQSKVRLAAAYARSLYRRSQLDQALAIAMRCRKYVEQELFTEARPNFGTRGELAYLVGRILRQQQRRLASRGHVAAPIFGLHSDSSD